MSFLCISPYHTELYSDTVYTVMLVSNLLLLYEGKHNIREVHEIM